MSQGQVASPGSDLVVSGEQIAPGATAPGIHGEPELTILMLHAMEQALSDRLDCPDDEKYEIFERAYDWVTLQIEKLERESGR